MGMQCHIWRVRQRGSGTSSPIRRKGHLARWQNTTKDKPLWFDCAQVTQQNSHEKNISERACDKSIIAEQQIQSNIQ